MNLLKQWICLSLFAIPFWCFGQELASADQQADTQQVAEKLIIEPNPLSLKIGGPRPYKGHVFFTDMNSGLWAVKVTPKQPEETPIDIRD